MKLKRGLFVALLLLSIMVIKAQTINIATYNMRNDNNSEDSIKKVLSKNDRSNSDGYPIILNLKKSFGWYDFSVFVKGSVNFERRYAGHVESGKASYSDPFMAGV